MKKDLASNFSFSLMLQWLSSFVKQEPMLTITPIISTMQHHDGLGLKACAAHTNLLSASTGALPQLAPRFLSCAVEPDKTAPRLHNHNLRYLFVEDRPSSSGTGGKRRPTLRPTQWDPCWNGMDQGMDANEEGKPAARRTKKCQKKEVNRRKNLLGLPTAPLSPITRIGGGSGAA